MKEKKNPFEQSPRLIIAEKGDSAMRKNSFHHFFLCSNIYAIT